MAQHARPVGPVTNAAAPFEPSMVQGSRPDRSPAREDWRQIQRRAGWHTAQTTHVQATFAPNMVSDTRPQQNRQLLPPRCDYDFIPPEVLLFSGEMVQGSRPEKPRIVLGPKIPLPWSQPTHVQAPFGPEMAQGAHPDSPRLFTFPKVGQVVSQTTHVVAPLGPEMVAGWQASTPRLFSKPQLGGQHNQTTFDVFVPMTPDMFAGWRPDQPRLFLAPRIPLPTSQLTHVAAPFGIEMVTGWTPTQPRVILKPRLGWQDGQLTFLTPMTPEMVAGWHPDRARLVLGPRIALPISQPTHTAAPIGMEMLRGWQPSTGVLRKPWPRGWIGDPSIDGDGGTGIDEDQAVPPMGKAFVRARHRRFVGDLMMGVTAPAVTRRWVSTAIVPRIAYSAGVLADAPVGYWQLDEPTGTTAADSSAGALHPGILLLTVTPGALGFLSDDQTAMETDGLDHDAGGFDEPSRVNIPNAFVAVTGTSALTVEIWVAPQTVRAGSGNFFLGSDDTNLAVGFSDHSFAGVPLSAMTIIAALKLGGTYRTLASDRPATDLAVPYHVVLTYTGSLLQLYVNGRLAASLAASGVLSLVGPLTLGSFGTAGEVACHARLQHAALYASALTPAQVAQHFGVGLPTIETALRLVTPVTARTVGEP